MDYSTIPVEDLDYLAHYGILGQKWGIRRFQNKDGTLTKQGKERYQNSDGSLTEEGIKKYTYPDGNFKYQGKKPTKEEKEMMRKYSQYHTNKARSEYDDILKLPKESKQRKDAESNYLKSATSYDPTIEDSSRYRILSELMFDNNMNYKNKKISDLSNKRSDTFYVKNGEKIRNKLTEELNRLTLKEIGFSNTPENIENVRYIWNWD